MELSSLDDVHTLMSFIRTRVMDDEAIAIDDDRMGPSFEDTTIYRCFEKSTD